MVTMSSTGPTNLDGCKPIMEHRCTFPTDHLTTNQSVTTELPQRNHLQVHRLLPFNIIVEGDVVDIIQTVIRTVMTEAMALNLVKKKPGLMIHALTRQKMVGDHISPIDLVAITLEARDLDVATNLEVTAGGQQVIRLTMVRREMLQLIF